ncbi:hypothetical protein ACGVWT_19100, partial [Sphingomonas sp. S6]
MALEPRFAPMIERLERLAADSPRSHGYRVLAAGMLGYAVLAGILLLFLSIGVQKGPPIGVQKGPPSSSSVTGMTGA